MDRFGRLVRRAVMRPLAVSQILSSASGALVIILAGLGMGSEQFVRFSLVNLIAVTVLGAARSFVFQPALIHRRADPDSATPLPWGLAAAATSGVVGALVGLPFVGVDPVGLMLVALGVGVPVLHDWMRYRFIAADRRWAVAAVDGGRLITVAASPLVLLAHPTAAQFQGYVGGALILPLLAAGWAIPRLTRHAAFALYRRAAGLQLADYAIGQLLTIVPLLVLGSLGHSVLLGGVRFAQTLLGPMNLVFNASATTLIADGATRESHARPADLIAEGRRLGRRIVLLAAIVVPAIVVVFWAARIEVSAVPNRQLVEGLVLAGALILTTGWSGIQVVLMRLLGFQAAVTIARAVLISVVVAGYLVGYAIGGIDLSLTVGFLTAAVANPIVFALPARSRYRLASET